MNYLDIWFAITGDRLPADHNYRLYSAVIDAIPEAKTLEWQLHTVCGKPDHKGWIYLNEKSRMGIRCQLGSVSLFSALEDKVLQIGMSFCRLGTLTGTAIKPHRNLVSRIVTIKSHFCPVNEFEFGVSLGKQLHELGLQWMPILGARKALRVKGRDIVGYSLRFEALPEDFSLSLQASGLGGRRRMGCGVFVGGEQDNG
ncbi:MAG: CRISPR-associated endonuclease Cas6 [Dehalococcoidia bacterium]|nr:CRISPR-associated endonuclease Cas6 [Chloroflexota bacterium]